MSIGFAPAIGPTISGFLIDAWGWRSMFWMLGATALAVMVLTVLLLDDVVRRPDHPGHFDLVSALLYSGGFVLVGAIAAVWCAIANLYSNYKHEEARRLYAKH